MKLLPCPFCGGEIHILEEGMHTDALGMFMLYHGDGQKGKCGLHSSGFGFAYYKTKQEAADHWNTRADGWVSVEDRLPEYGQLQLVCVEQGPTLVHNGKKLGGFRYDIKAYRRGEWLRPLEPGAAVTHWKPLGGLPNIGD